MCKGESIKGAERKSQGDSDKLLIRTSKMKMPMDFKTFLNNGQNKERLFELFEETCIQRKSGLNERQIYFARKDSCKLFTSTICVMNNEEADPKLVSLVRHASEPNTEHENVKYLVRSCSMDIDIPVVFLFLPVNVNY